MYSEIFLTNPSFCSALRDTFSGRSGQSMTPFKSIRYSGMTSLMLSAINTWLLYSLMVPSMDLLGVDTREVEDTFEVERIVHVQVDPEQRLAVVVEDFAVEFFIILIAALVWMFGPQRVDITDGNRAFVDFYFSLWPGKLQPALSFRLLFLSLRILRPRGCALRQRRRLLIRFHRWSRIPAAHLLWTGKFQPA